MGNLYDHVKLKMVIISKDTEWVEDIRMLKKTD